MTKKSDDKDNKNKVLGDGAAGDVNEPELRSPSDNNYGVPVEPQDQEKTGDAKADGDDR